MPRVSGDFVWIFDDDDVALPTSIADRVAAFTPEAGAVFSKHFWGRSAADGRIEPGELIEWPEVDRSNVALTLMRGCFTTLQGALVRTASYRSVGPFREDCCGHRITTCSFAWCGVPRRAAAATDFHLSSARRAARCSRVAARRLRTEKVWARYDGLVGRRLRQDAALGEFLMPSVAARCPRRSSARRR